MTTQEAAALVSRVIREAGGETAPATPDGDRVVAELPEGGPCIAITMTEVDVWEAIRRSCAWYGWELPDYIRKRDEQRVRKDNDAP